jgi:hypothetical protein
MTVTFIESRYPEKLLEHLKNDRGYTVEEKGNGIYTINSMCQCQNDEGGNTGDR